MEEKLKIAVFIDFDNIEIGVKSTLQREFDVAAVLDALKERGEIVTKIAYANWGRQESSTRQLDESPRQSRAPREQHQSHGGGGGGQQSSGQGQHQRGRRPAPLDLALAMPLVERALQVLERREVRPQLGLLKSTMLQLDSTFNEKAYGSGSFSDFVEKLKKSGMVNVTGGEGRYMISRKDSAEPEKVAAKPEQAIPILRDVLESHRIEMDEGCTDDTLAEWVQAEQPNFDWKSYGFQEFSEFLNYAQDKMLVRVSPQEESGLLVHLGPEFHPPLVPEPAPVVVADEQQIGRASCRERV